jgi:hypothetical protein
MNIGAAVFGMFCLVAVFAGIVFIVAVNAQEPQYTDSYGNTLAGNPSQALVGNISSNQAVQTNIPLVLIVGAIIVCMVVFCIYLAAKVFLHD